MPRWRSASLGKAPARSATREGCPGRSNVSLRASPNQNPKEFKGVQRQAETDAYRFGMGLFQRPELDEPRVEILARARGLWRSREMDHFCSREVTQSKNAA
jgi:hypothetical protein